MMRHGVAWCVMVCQDRRDLNRVGLSTGDRGRRRRRRPVPTLPLCPRPPRTPPPRWWWCVRAHPTSAHRRCHTRREGAGERPPLAPTTGCVPPSALRRARARCIGRGVEDRRTSDRDRNVRPQTLAPPAAVRRTTTTTPGRRRAPRRRYVGRRGWFPRLLRAARCISATRFHLIGAAEVVLRLLLTHAPRAEAGVVVDLPFFTPPPRSGALLRGELGCARRTHGSEAGCIVRVGAARSADAHVHVR